MLRTSMAWLHQATLGDVVRLWLRGQPRCSLWQSSSVLAKRTPGGGRPTDNSESGSSSSSDSDSDNERGKEVDPKLKKAAEGVALSIPKHGAAVKSDLLQQLQSFAKLTKDQASGASPPAAASKVSDLLSQMQVKKSISEEGGEKDNMFQQTRPRPNRSFQRQFAKRRQQGSREKVELFDGHGLGIFTADKAAKTPKEQVTDVVPSRRVSLWEKVEQEQLHMFRKQPPSNAFEEMIQWTTEGKLWKFPIDNEQGMDEEKKIGFHEHVFLGNQIQDFPRRGPIRHFMDLVLIGLSKNPYLTVQQKHEHIDWFRQYFREKQSVLQEALGQNGLMQTSDASKTS